MACWGTGTVITKPKIDSAVPYMPKLAMVPRPAERRTPKVTKSNSKSDSDPAAVDSILPAQTVQPGFAMFTVGAVARNHDQLHQQCQLPLVTGGESGIKRIVPP